MAQIKACREDESTANSLNNAETPRRVMSRLGRLQQIAEVLQLVESYVISGKPLKNSCTAFSRGHSNRTMSEYHHLLPPAL